MPVRPWCAILWGTTLLAGATGLAQETGLPPLPSTGLEMPGGWLVPVWTVEVHDDEPFALSPRDPGECLPLPDLDQVVCGTRKGLLLALSVRDGSERWSRRFPGTFRGRPAMAEGTLLVAGGNGCLHLLDPVNGASLWERPYCAQSPFLGEPALAGRVLVAVTIAEQVHGIDLATRMPLWKFDQGPPRLLASEGAASPTVLGSDVLVGLSNGLLVRLSGETGKPIWTAPLGVDLRGATDVDATPVVRDGVAYTAAFGKGPVAVKADDGTILWRGSEYGASRALVTETQVIVGTADGTVVSLRRSDGQVSWRTRISSTAAGSPVSIGRRIVVTGTRGIWLLDLRTGKPLDHRSLLWGVEGTPAVFGNRIFFVGNGGAIHAVDVLVP